MSTLRQVLAIVGKDLLIEWRTRDLLATMGVMGLATIVIFNFAVDFSRMPFSELGAPVLWLAFIFTGMTGLSRSFALERENSCLEGMLLAPVDRGAIYVGKLIVNVLVLFVFEVFLLGLALLLLNQGRGAVHLEGERWLVLLGVMLLNTTGFAAVGTLFALMAQRTRRGDVLLPVMQAVLSLPVLIPAVVTTQRVLHAEVPLGDIRDLVRLSAVFAVVVVAVALIMFEYVVEE